MQWTTERPTAEGWYWWRRPIPVNGQYFPRVCKVFRLSETSALYVEGINPSYFLLENASGDWAGPIPQPEEA